MVVHILHTETQNTHIHIIIICIYRHSTCTPVCEHVYQLLILTIYEADIFSEGSVGMLALKYFKLNDFEKMVKAIRSHSGPSSVLSC